MKEGAFFKEFDKYWSIPAGTFVTLTGKDLLLYGQFEVKVGETGCVQRSLWVKVVLFKFVCEILKIASFGTDDRGKSSKTKNSFEFFLWNNLNFQADLLVSKSYFYLKLIFCFLTKCQFPKPEFYLNRKTDMSQTFIRTQFLRPVTIGINDYSFGCPIIYTDTIHNVIFSKTSQQCLIQQRSFSNWEAMLGNNCWWCSISNI